MQHPEERAVLSKSNPAALWRMARWLGLANPECHCIPCMCALVEWCAREMIDPNWPRD
jgi:hypothetical protein